MYVGRIVAIGRNRAGANAVLYRVSSRSFPNRRMVERDGALAVVSREGSEGDLAKNPYITYNALRLTGPWAVAGNGSHTDLIAEKIEAGAPPKDALAQALLELDYEHDELSTPRIAAVVPVEGDEAWLGIIRRDALMVREVVLTTGQAMYLATYEADEVRDSQSSAFDAATAEEAARFAIDGGGFAALERPVTSAAALVLDGAFTLGSHTV